MKYGDRSTKTILGIHAEQEGRRYAAMEGRECK